MRTQDEENVAVTTQSCMDKILSFLGDPCGRTVETVVVTWKRVYDGEIELVPILDAPP